MIVSLKTVLLTFYLEMKFILSIRTIRTLTDLNDTLIKKTVFIVMTLFLILSTITGQEFSRQIKVLSTDKNNQIPNAYFIVSTNNNKLIFSTDESGEVTIHYNNFSLSDSILVTSIGYKSNRAVISNLNDVIYLDPIYYKLNEVVVKPKKVKQSKLGNLAHLAISSFQIGFGCQKVIFIPSNGSVGKIVKIRYFMHDFSNKEFKFRPFKVRIYEPDSKTGKVGTDILKDEIIAILPRNEGNWVEIDLSQFNINMPNNGVFVGLEVLPYEYYFSNGYISSRSIPHNNTQRANTLSIGCTLKKHSSLDIQSWDYITPSRGWIQLPIHELFPLIQITVEN